MEVRTTPLTTKVFMNGRSQAVRIPAEFRFEEDELFVNKIGDTLIMAPKSSLVESMMQGLSLISDDFMEEGRSDEIPTVRENF